MNFKIDSTVTFELRGGRRATVDARELRDWKEALFTAKGRPPAADQPGEPATMDWDIAIAETKAWIREKTTVELSDEEAVGIFEHVDFAWREMRKNLRPPTAAASQPSQPSTDPRYSD